MRKEKWKEQRNEKMRERLDGKKANMPPSSEFCLDSAIISSSPGRILDVSRSIHFSHASPNKWRSSFSLFPKYSTVVESSFLIFALIENQTNEKHSTDNLSRPKSAISSDLDVCKLWRKVNVQGLWWNWKRWMSMERSLSEIKCQTEVSCLYNV